MNGDEDLGEDILMKGEKFHYNQRPADHKLFATGMNGDEDLGEDIIMKGEPYHYVQKKWERCLDLTPESQWTIITNREAVHSVI